MDIQFNGANCVVISGKQARLVVDDNLAALGAKAVSKDGDVTTIAPRERRLLSISPENMKFPVSLFMASRPVRTLMRRVSAPQQCTSSCWMTRMCSSLATSILS
jgi:hypothetical protein